MYSIELDLLCQARAKMKLYRNVTNVPELRQRVLKGKLQCCIIKPSLIIHPLQVIVAANKAVTANKLKTRTVYTEILFNLSVSKNITQSLQTFGISDNEKDILVVVIEKKEENLEDIFKDVQGEEVALEALSEISNMNLIKKVYKLNDIETEHIQAIDSIVSKIAAKDCIL